VQLAGKIAQSFIQSKLTPIIVLASILLGVFAVIVTPREEEPQIIVPMIDVFVSYPGASAKEVEQRVCSPMEKFLWEIEGVEYVYTTSSPESGMAIVRFYVGSNMEESIVKLYNKLMSNYDKIPPGVSQPLVKPRSINDVPTITLTLWSKNPAYTGYELRRIAAELCDNLKQDPDTRDITITGGQKRRVTISLDPAKLKAYQTTASQIMRVLGSANYRLISGAFPSGNEQFVVETGGFLNNAQDVGRVVVNVSNLKPVQLKDLAQITDGPEEISNYVLTNSKPETSEKHNSDTYEAVTISIAKKKGTNATDLSNRILEKTKALRGVVIPVDVEITTTRNYGYTAKEKVDELLKHMLIAAVSVTVLIAIALGLRSSLIVLVAVPVTLALTIFNFYRNPGR
jgi:multidrug efflux pump subunit AcrB